jgi:hypothetical protein
MNGTNLNPAPEGLTDRLGSLAAQAVGARAKEEQCNNSQAGHRSNASGT